MEIYELSDKIKSIQKKIESQENDSVYSKFLTVLNNKIVHIGTEYSGTHNKSELDKEISTIDKNINIIENLWEITTNMKKLLTNDKYTELHTAIKRRATELEKLFQKKLTQEIDIKLILEEEKQINFIKKDINKIEELMEHIKFQDREEQLKEIKRQLSAFNVLINAPFGYGKTSLLNFVRFQMEEDDEFFGIPIELDHNEDNICFETLTLLIIKEIRARLVTEDIPIDGITPGSSAAIFIKNSLSLKEKKNDTKIKGILLTIDNAELIDNTHNIYKHELKESTFAEKDKECFRNFVSEFQNGLKRIDKKLKIIFAGCSLPKIETFTGMLGRNINLDPFNFSIVESIVDSQQKEDKNKEPDRKKHKELASYLMVLTGGHPGAIAHILNEWNKFDVAPPKYLLSTEHFFKDHVKKIAETIRDHIPDLFTILSTLSPVRRFDERFLTHLREKELINWDGEISKLVRELRATHFVIIGNGGFFQDCITQRLLAAHMRNESRDIFIKVQNEAKCFYEDCLTKPEIHGIEIIAGELFFQNVQYIDYKDIKDKQTLFDQLLEIPKKLIKLREPIEIMRDFIYNILESDWEFQFTINYVCNPVGDKYPYLNIETNNTSHCMKKQKAPYDELMEILKNKYCPFV